MEEAGVHEVDIAADSLLIEAGEKGGRGRSVKTLIVIKDAYSQIWFPLAGLLPGRSEKQLELLVWRFMSRRLKRKFSRFQNFRVTSKEYAETMQP